MGKNAIVILPVNGPDGFYPHRLVFLVSLSRSGSLKSYSIFNFKLFEFGNSVSLLHMGRAILSFIQLSLHVSFSCGLEKSAVCFSFVEGLFLNFN